MKICDEIESYFDSMTDRFPICNPSCPIQDKINCKYHIITTNRCIKNKRDA